MQVPERKSWILHMENYDKEKETNTSIKKINIYCEIGFVLGIFSFFFSGFFIVPLLAVAFSSVGLITFRNTRHKDKWKAYWGIFLGILLALTNFV